MPLYQQFNCSKTNVQIAVWNLTEPIETLNALAQNNNVPPPPLTHTYPKRHAEWYAPRLLLKHLLTTATAHITYRQPQHQPYITQQQALPFEQSHFVSISHTRQAVAIAIHAAINIGIDIEHISNKPYLLQAKFLNPNTELPFCKYSTIEEAHFFSTLFWSAKEAVYKWYAKKNITFVQNIEIQNIATILKQYFLSTNTGNFEVYCRVQTHEAPLRVQVFFNQILPLQHLLTWCCAESDL